MTRQHHLKGIRTDLAGEQAVGRLRRANAAELIGRANRVRHMRAPKLSDEAISNRLGRLMDGFAHKPMLLATNAVFRARKNNGIAEFRSAKELWYPPTEVARLGRFNSDGESVFYSASSVAAALWEVSPRVGDKITVLACGARSTMANVVCAQIGLHLYEGKPQPAELPSADLRADTEFQHGLRSARVDRKWQIVDDVLAYFAAASVSEVPDLYRITGALGKTLRKMPQVEGLTYPSVATNLKAYNTVLSREAADRHFFACEAWEFEVLRWDETPSHQSKAQSRLLPIRAIRRSESIGQNGEIHWGVENAGVMQELSSVVSRVEIARSTLVPHALV